ncbi:unnamed protein product [Protopolystoma xenopodis]|uniref:Uncharacterized protein n=1 Tax=Protopolystoma xenopodis TaxID=117903 RepID=A0A448XER6_9PLAT|nr:unnamed protein product [Protopolystoma xenopodis]
MPRVSISGPEFCHRDLGEAKERLLPEKLTQKNLLTTDWRKQPLNNGHSHHRRQCASNVHSFNNEALRENVEKHEKKKERDVSCNLTGDMAKKQVDRERSASKKTNPALLSKHPLTVPSIPASEYDKSRRVKQGLLSPNNFQYTFLSSPLSSHSPHPSLVPPPSPSREHPSCAPRNKSDRKQTQDTTKEENNRSANLSFFSSHRQQSSQQSEGNNGKFEDRFSLYSLHKLMHSRLDLDQVSLVNLRSEERAFHGTNKEVPKTFCESNEASKSNKITGEKKQAKQKRLKNYGKSLLSSRSSSKISPEVKMDVMKGNELVGGSKKQARARCRLAGQRCSIPHLLPCRQRLSVGSVALNVWDRIMERGIGWSRTGLSHSKSAGSLNSRLAGFGMNTNGINVRNESKTMKHVDEQRLSNDSTERPGSPRENILKHNLSRACEEKCQFKSKFSSVHNELDRPPRVPTAPLLEVC